MVSHASAIRAHLDHKRRLGLRPAGFMRELDTNLGHLGYTSVAMACDDSDGYLSS
jgi:hypothetical protein